MHKISIAISFFLIYFKLNYIRVVTMDITKEQLRGAMGLLGINQTELCKLAKVSPPTIVNVFKDGQSNDDYETKGSTIKKLINAFEDKGIEFIPYGVQLKPKETITQYRGHTGFVQFMKDVADTAERLGADCDICVSNVDETLFEKWQGDYAEIYLSRMATASKKTGFKSRIIVKEGDYYCTAVNYAEYRQVRKDMFIPASSYIYGDKFATIIFSENDIEVHVINNKATASAQRIAFNSLWAGLGA